MAYNTAPLGKYTLGDARRDGILRTEASVLSWKMMTCNYYWIHAAFLSLFSPAAMLRERKL